MHSFYNSTNESGDTLDLFTSKARTQNEQVLGIFGFRSNVPMSPSQVHKWFKYQYKPVPLTSIRRAITTLAQTCKKCEKRMTEDSSIRFVETTKEGKYRYCICPNPQPYLVKTSEREGELLLSGSTKDMSEIINSDCMEYLPKYKDNEFNLAIVDPPYGIGNFSVEKSKRKPYNKKWQIEWNNSIPRKEYFNQLQRVAKNHIIFGFQFYKKYLWDELTGVIIHNFNGGGFQSQADVAITNLQNKVSVFNYNWHGFIKGNQKDTDGNRIHPCEKPLSLYEWLLMNYAKEGDKILDTHFGSGSSIIACERLGFDITAIEIDKDYYEAAMKRIKLERSKLRLF